MHNGTMTQSHTHTHTRSVVSGGGFVMWVVVCSSQAEFIQVSKLIWLNQFNSYPRRSPSLPLFLSLPTSIFFPLFPSFSGLSPPFSLSFCPPLSQSVTNSPFFSWKPLWTSEVSRCVVNSSNGGMEMTVTMRLGLSYSLGPTQSLCWCQFYSKEKNLFNAKVVVEVARHFI